MRTKWLTSNRRKILTMAEAALELRSFTDVSDPDLDLPQHVHALQTAERIRRAGGDEWLQVTGLIHDFGKILSIWGSDDVGTGKEEQWAIVGDTWVTGCTLPESAVYPELNSLNPDSKDTKMSSELGVYKKGCGLDELIFTFGHDEYLHGVLVLNEHKLPKEALDMVRFHSCYPLHSSDSYKKLLKPGDEERLVAVRRFNAYDLYSKSEEVPNWDEHWPYYQSLLSKFFPKPISWPVPH